jgi:C-methyltransferase
MWVSRMLHAVTELGVADALPAQGDSPIEELAASTGVDSSALDRVLRALAAHGVFARNGDGRYRHTDLSRTLRRDHPGSLRNLALLSCADWQWRSWANLTGTIRSGRSGFVTAYGKDIRAYFAEDDPDAGAVFQGAMTDLAAHTDRILAEAIDLAGPVTVADVGGGHGSLLAAILDRHGEVDAVLVESEATLRGLSADPRTAALAARLRLQPADIVRAVDCAADVYLLKQVIHVFDDETAVRVLRNCAAGARPGARFVVIERLVTGEAAATLAKLMDVQMLVVELRGRERTERELTALFDRAGLAASRITPTPSGMSLVEAVN